MADAMPMMDPKQVHQQVHGNTTPCPGVDYEMDTSACKTNGKGK